MDYLCYPLTASPSGFSDMSLLDEEEKKAYSRRGSAYLRERSLLKQELARRTRRDARSIRLSISANGKPFLPGGPHFNISHSGEWLCFAFHHLPVGVDIQKAQCRLPIDRLARRIMCPAQYRAFSERGSQSDEFFACWCTAEALVKQAGATIWQVQDFPFLYEAGHIIPQYPSAPQVRLFSPADGYFGAVAYEVQACQPQE